MINDSIGLPTPEKINQVLQEYNKKNHYLIGAFLEQQLVGVIGFELIAILAVCKADCVFGQTLSIPYFGMNV